jgi:hypothetical protein
MRVVVITLLACSFLGRAHLRISHADSSHISSNMTKYLGKHSYKEHVLYQMLIDCSSKENTTLIVRLRSGKELFGLEAYMIKRSP